MSPIPRRFKRWSTPLFPQYGRLDFAHNNAGIVGGGAPIAELDEDGLGAGHRRHADGRLPLHEVRDPAHRGARSGRRDRQHLFRGGPHRLPGDGRLRFQQARGHRPHPHCGTRNLRRRVRVNAICPGTARSRMVNDWMGDDPALEKQVVDLHPIGRIAEPEEIAAAVALAVLDPSPRSCSGTRSPSTAATPSSRPPTPCPVGPVG